MVRVIASFYIFSRIFKIFFVYVSPCYAPIKDFRDKYTFNQFYAYFHALFLNAGWLSKNFISLMIAFAEFFLLLMHSRNFPI